MGRGTAALRAGLVVFLAAGCGLSVCAEEVPAPSYSWGGFYLGAHLGGALALSDANDPFGGSIYGNTARSPGPIAGGQIGYNWQHGRGLLGLEADASWADLFGTETCFAYSGFYVSANCRAETNAIGTLAARFGWLVGSDAGTLLYGKAGAAWRSGSVDATTNDDPGYPTTSADGVRWGWMLGAGVERAVSPRWSLKAEYDYLNFGDQGLATPISGFQSVPSADPNDLIPVGSRGTDVATDAHLFKVGLNYRLQGASSAVADPPAPPPQPIAGTALEIGARYVYGWGRFQKDLGIQGEGLNSLASRLTYSDMKTSGAEIFARLDLHNGLMVKGLVGKGDGSGGHLNDEDWGLPFASFVPYSNTWSDVSDEIRYGVIDVGHDIWRDNRFRFAPFVGYSILHQYMQGFGCIQLANQNSDCHPPIPTSTEAISEDDIWRAMRLGIAGDLQLVPGLTLSADAAYLPYVHISGVDDHVLRSLISPEHANGSGTQLELILKYAVTERLSIGVGGRYWAMWTKDGIVNFGGDEAVPMRFSVEQAALLFQGSYTFSDTEE